MQSTEIFEGICDLVEDRISQLGLVTTGEAWELCKDHYGYSTIVANFKHIMDLMVEQGKAKKIKRGTWIVLKPNKKNEACSDAQKSDQNGVPYSDALGIR